MPAKATFRESSYPIREGFPGPSFVLFCWLARPAITRVGSGRGPHEDSIDCRPEHRLGPDLRERKLWVAESRGGLHRALLEIVDFYHTDADGSIFAGDNRGVRAGRDCSRDHGFQRVLRGETGSCD